MGNEEQEKGPNKRTQKKNQKKDQKKTKKRLKKKFKKNYQKKRTKKKTNEKKVVKWKLEGVGHHQSLYSAIKILCYLNQLLIDPN